MSVPQSISLRRRHLRVVTSSREVREGKFEMPVQVMVVYDGPPEANAAVARRHCLANRGNV